jgi:hypothetical protein
MPVSGPGWLGVECRWASRSMCNYQGEYWKLVRIDSPPVKYRASR